MAAPVRARGEWRETAASWVRQPRRLAAADRAARTAVVSFAGYAIGRWAADDVQVAVFATFTGLALLGIAEFGGTRRGRCAAITGGAITGFGLAALGTWASSQPVWADVAVTAVTGAGIVAIGLLGGFLAAGASAVTLFYLIAVGSPVPFEVTRQRIAGIALGGALCVAAVALRPGPGAPPALDVLAERLAWLGRRLQDLSGAAPTTAEPPPGHVPVRSVIDALGERPGSPSAADRAALYLVNDVERLDALLRRLEPAAMTAPERHAAASLASQLLACSARLRAAGLPGQQALAAHRQGADGVAPGVRPYSLIARAAVVVRNIGQRTDMITRRAPEGPDGAAALATPAPAAPALAAPGLALRGLLTHGVLRVRANLTWRSVHLQDAVRIGAALGLAVGAARAFGLQHGFWVTLATLTIVRSTVTATGRRASQALAGTVIGLAVGFVLIDAAGSRTSLFAVLTPVAIFGAIYAANAIGFLAGQAAFTVAVLVLFSLLAPTGWRLGVARIEDVTAGALIGLAVGAVAWPRGPAAAIGPAIASLLDTSSSYLTRTLQVVGGAAGPDGLDRLRRDATGAAVVAESAFAEYLATRPPADQLQRYLSCLSAASRLWYAADILRVTPALPADAPSWAELAPLAHALQETASLTAFRLRSQRIQPSREPGSLAVTDPAGRAGDEHPDDDSLQGWIRDLAEQLRPGRADRTVS